MNLTARVPHVLPPSPHPPSFFYHFSKYSKNHGAKIQKKKRKKKKKTTPLTTQNESYYSTRMERAWEWRREENNQYEQGGGTHLTWGPYPLVSNILKRVGSRGVVWLEEQSNLHDKNFNGEWTSRFSPIIIFFLNLASSTHASSF